MERYGDISPLLSLPDELILRILSFVHPEDLVSVATINERLQRLTSDKTVVRCVRFYSDVHLEHSVIKNFFSEKPRTLNITELDVCNCLWISHSLLEQCIIRCKHLERLKIVNCNISQAALCRILGRLQYVIELAWSLLDGELDLNKFGELARAKPPIFLKLQDLYMEVVGNSLILAVVHTLLEECLNLQRFHLHVIESLKNVPEHTVPVPLGNHLHSVLPNLGSLTLSSEKGGGRCPFTFRDPIVIYTDSIFYQLLQKRIPSVPDFENWIKVLEQFNQMPAMYKTVIVKTDDKEVCHKSVVIAGELNSKNQIAPDVKEVTVIMSDASDLKTINQWPQHWKSEMLTIVPLKAREDFLTQDIPLLGFSFETLVNIFQNITEINLQRFHFPHGFRVCKILAGGLKNLNALALPACAVFTLKDEKKNEKEFLGFFKRQRTSLTTKLVPAESPLKHFLENGIKLVELDIRGSNHEGHSFCGACRSDNSCTNEAFSILVDFSSLQKLTLANLQNIQNFSFLMGKQVKSLRLHTVGPTGLCMYSSALRQVLDYNHNLTSLMMKHPALDMNSNLLWDTLAKASNLRRICIVSYNNNSLNINSIATILFKLPYLRVLHIHSRACNYKVTNERLKDVWDSLGKMNQYRLVVDINTSGQAYKNVFPADQSDLCLMSCSVGHVKPRYRENLDAGNSYFAM